jgi:hypothetical protein
MLILLLFYLSSLISIIESIIWTTTLCSIPEFEDIHRLKHITTVEILVKLQVLTMILKDGSVNHCIFNY